MRCLWHQEATASLVQRKDGWYCYGICGKLYSNAEVEARTGETYEYEQGAKEKEDLGRTFRQIDALPVRTIRGLSFKYNDLGYYICWPEKSYYKLRLFNPGRGGKYLSPKGHSVPLFWGRNLGRSTLAVVEGEINALSVAQSMPEWDVCSPGSATCFSAKHLAKYLTEFKKYNSLIVVLDDDGAGLKGLIEAKAFFLYKVPFITFKQIAPDANEVYVKEGKEALRRRLSGDHRE